MKICVLSNKGSSLSEGQRNMATTLATELAKSNKILHLNAKEALKNPFRWSNIKNFDPDIIHFFLRPKLTTFFFAKFLQRYLGRVPVVFSAMQSAIGSFHKFDRLQAFLRPTLVLALTEETECSFKKVGMRTSRMICGVDLEKFREPTEEQKIMLKRKYKFDAYVPVALHVGHLTRGRNLETLVAKKDQRSIYKLLIVASPLFESNKDLERLLKSRGAIIIREYIENIQEIYQLADLYVFPTISDSFCIQAPLSVFEAMATNLPVFSTKFGVLKDYFTQGKGLTYVNDPSEIPVLAEKYLKGDREVVQTRMMVSRYTWSDAASQLISVYEELKNAR